MRVRYGYFAYISRGVELMQCITPYVTYVYEIFLFKSHYFFKKQLPCLRLQNNASVQC